MSSEKVFSNFIWRFAERIGAKGVELIVSIVLARLLAPDVFGTIALVTVFITILNVFVDSGLGNALIQKKDADEIDFSTVFYFNILVCTLLYFVMFLVAPVISDFYGDSTLIPVIRVLSFTLVISGVKNVQQAYVSRTMQFKRFFFATLGGTIGAAVLGIFMAYCGYGIWSLVAQQIFNATVDTIILWITVKWRPQKKFSLDRLKGLFGYGWKLLISSLLDTVYKDITQLIIGKVYLPTDLAFYNRGKQFPNLIVTNINASIDSVLFPTMSKEQDNAIKVKSMARRAIKTSTYIMAPLMIGLACCADTVVRILLTDKWIGCVPYLRVFCIIFMFYPIHTANLNALKAMGRSELILKLEVMKKTIGLIILFATVWFGPLIMAYGLLVASFINQIVNAWPNRKLLEYGYLEQLKDIFSSILLAVVMGVIVYMFSFVALPTFWVLIIQVLIGGSFYIIASGLLHIDSFGYLLGIVKSFRKRGK